MRAYSRVAPQFWTGATGRALRAAGRDAQVVALYLITCPDALMTGVFNLPFSRLCEETGVRPGRARAALEVLNREGFAEYDFEASVVWVPEMARFQVGRDPKPDDKRIKGFLRELETASHPVFVGKFIAKYREAFQLDEESLQGVLRGGFPSKMVVPEAPREPHRRTIGAPSESHRSPIPAPEPSPEPAPAPEPEREAARGREDEVFRIWEENRGRLKGVTKRSDERRRKIAARLKEVPDLDRWRVVIQRFARGWAGRQPWAKLDFLIKSETNFLKVEEGTYDESTTRGARPTTRPHESGRYAGVDRQAEIEGQTERAAKESAR